VLRAVTTDTEQAPPVSVGILKLTSAARCPAVREVQRSSNPARAAVQRAVQGSLAADRRRLDLEARLPVHRHSRADRRPKGQVQVADNGDASHRKSRFPFSLCLCAELTEGSATRVPGHVARVSRLILKGFWRPGPTAGTVGSVSALTFWSWRVSVLILGSSDVSLISA
jgi:hypothetical protein